MDKDTRNAIERTTQKARELLQEDFAGQLDGVFDVRPDGRIAEKGGAHLTGPQHLLRNKIVAAIDHKRNVGMTPAEAVADYIRDAAFTALNRFVALKMLEARELVQECISRGDGSSGFAEFCGLVPAVKTANGAGYRLYIESIFDELSTEVKVLFDRRDAASVLWPKKITFDQLLEILSADELKSVWREDETLGWVYQFFNSGEERRKMREKSAAPRNSRELAIRNQFFTPQYVVQFLADNTLGRIWYEMRNASTQLAQMCEYMTRTPDETWGSRPKRDPRDIKVLDPACGSGHFLLYCFSLLLLIYEEAWADADSPNSAITGRTLRDDYPDLLALRAVLPGLILGHNLHGVDIDPRCAQIAELALWMRAQRAFRNFGIARTDRPVIRRTNIVIAEPMPGERELLAEFLRGLKEDRLEELLRRALDIPPERTMKATKAMADSLADLVATVWHGMELAGEMGPLLKIEHDLANAIKKGRAEWDDRFPLYRVAEYGLGEVSKETLVGDISGTQEDFWAKSERLVFQALTDYAATATGAGAARRRLFAEDAAQGFALADLVAKRYDIVLMNPPFGDCAEHSKNKFEHDYPSSKNDLYAAFIDRAADLCSARGRIGAITPRTGFFLSSFRGWREKILLRKTSLKVVADLGFGVLDSAMVETVAYCMETSR